ncbi:hypothetical protein GGS23DRAFT_33276 [Durotheca rogersii]|uniref:uncharacterized protein n=1 Tax=Durotheca rogersii TaxID=419775 RepID=UPI00221F86F3|nr:uncharacterized protein GGS23DRAFT_33276 [Durotheca rogersii]KAI5868485.1 hypothetical protein GGS23DRAFT_33276 [Durotheca rogersii]
MFPFVLGKENLEASGRTERLMSNRVDNPGYLQLTYNASEPMDVDPEPHFCTRHHNHPSCRSKNRCGSGSLGIVVAVSRRRRSFALHIDRTTSLLLSRGSEERQPSLLSKPTMPDDRLSRVGRRGTTQFQITTPRRSICSSHSHRQYYGRCSRGHPLFIYLRNYSFSNLRYRPQRDGGGGSDILLIRRRFYTLGFHQHCEALGVGYWVEATSPCPGGPRVDITEAPSLRHASSMNA